MDKGLDLLFGLFHRLHRLDITEFTDITGVSYTEDATQTILDYYSSCVEEVLPWIEPVVIWLRENKPENSLEPQSLLHRDYHGMNVMIGEDDKPYVIDWSAAMIGDYRIDLAWTILLGTTFGGEFFRDLIIGKYSELSGQTIEDIEFYEVVAATRRIIDFGKTMTGGSSASGLKPEIVELMKESKEHFQKVHDFLTERTGIRLNEFDLILNSI
jgi:aminoglycoside phosphotransferase (APT) family kinase protein